MSPNEMKRVIDSAKDSSKFFEISCRLKICIFGHVLFDRVFVFPPDKKGGEI